MTFVYQSVTKKKIVSFVKRDINDKNIYFQLQILQSCSL